MVEDPDPESNSIENESFMSGSSPCNFNLWIIESIECNGQRFGAHTVKVLRNGAMPFVALAAALRVPLTSGLSVTACRTSMAPC